MDKNCKDLLGSPDTPSSLSHHCSSRETVEGIDPAVEVQLDESIAAHGRPVVEGPWRTIFLTGATGFLGAFLLRDLLKAHDQAKASRERE